MKKKDTMRYGSGGGSLFTELSFRGQPMIEPYKMTSHTAYFRHIYAMPWPIDKLGYQTQKGRHMCLRSGYWCFQNILDRPQDIVGYLIDLFASRSKGSRKN